MKRLLVGCAIGLAVTSSGLGQAIQGENFQEQAFLEGGTVRLQLSSGGYTIRAGTGNRLRVQWQAETPDHQKDMKRVNVRTDISRNVATIHTDGPTKHARVVIEVPAKSDLFLRLRAGDVRIIGIEGNKDIHMTAGDLDIDVSPESYSHVHASVSVGDLHARVLGFSDDGFKNSFDWNGSGKYTLHASLFAGDLTLARENSRSDRLGR